MLIKMILDSIFCEDLLLQIGLTSKNFLQGFNFVKMAKNLKN